MRQSSTSQQSLSAAEFLALYPFGMISLQGQEGQEGQKAY